MNPSIPLPATKKAAPSRQREKTADLDGLANTIASVRRYCKLCLIGFGLYAWLLGVAVLLDSVLRVIILGVAR